MSGAIFHRADDMSCLGNMMFREAVLRDGRGGLRATAWVSQGEIEQVTGPDD